MSSVTPAPDQRRLIDLGDDVDGQVEYRLSPAEFLRVESAACNASVEAGDPPFRIRGGCIFQDQFGTIVARSATNWFDVDPVAVTFRISFGFAIGATQSITPAVPADSVTATAGLADTVLPPFSVVALFIAALDNTDNDTPLTLFNGALWVFPVDVGAGLVDVNPLLVPIPLSEQLVAA